MAAPLSAGQRPTQNRVEIVAVNDSTFRVTGNPTAGLVFLRLTNRSSAIQSAHLVAVGPGRSLEEAEQRLRANQAVPWMGNAGGIGPVGVNRSFTVAQELPAGEYFVVGRRLGPSGRPRHTSGMLARITVTGRATDVSRLHVDGRITLDARFAFWKTMYNESGREILLTAREFGAPLRRGERIWRVENTGGQFHELVILHARNSQPQAMTMFAENRALPPGVTPVGGLGYLPPGARAWLHLNLEPGVYSIFCPVRHRGGQPGHMVGEQIQQFVR